MAPAVAVQAAQEVALRGDGNKSYLGLSDVSELGLCARDRGQEEVLDPSWELRSYTSTR